MKFKIINTTLIAVAFFTFDFAYSQQTPSDSTGGIKEKNIQEVVLIGYGSVKKKDATGSVESIKADSFNKGISTSPEQLLQGKSAGVQVTQSTGEPGGANSVRIRGVSSIRAGSDPLYVVDGVPLSGGNVSSGTTDVGLGMQTARNPLNFINPSDIESMDILKDASATAIYGSRGANGVILITTKKGRKGAGQLTFDVSQTISKIAHDYNLLDAATFAKNTAATNNYGSNVNAFKEILRVGSTQSYNLGYGGGSDTGNYRFSLGYLDQEGIIKNSGIRKYNASINLTENFFDKRLKLESAVSISNIHDTAAPLSDNIGAEGDLLISALKWNPTRSFYDANGNFLNISNNQRNPLDLLAHYTDYTDTNRVIGNIASTFKIVKGLDYKVNLGVDYSNSNRNVGLSQLIGIDDIRGAKGLAQKIYLAKTNYIIEHTLNYNTNLASELELNAIAGYSYQKFENKGNTFIGSGFGNYTDQNYYIDNITAATKYESNGPRAQTAFSDPSNKLQSYFGRAIFTYAGKYILNGTIRRDGSSKFGIDNKYGTFPAVSAAWKINKEEFAPKVFDELKLRAGWGITGNQDFPAGSASLLVKPVNGIPTIANVDNKLLKWEETKQYNAGIDFAVLGNRLTGAIDVYNKETTNPLLVVAVADPSPYPTKWTNLPNTKINSKGLELSLNYKIINTENISWDFGGNVSFLNSKVTNLIQDGYPTGILTGNLSGQGLSGAVAQGHYDGEALYTFNLLQFQGYDASGKSIYQDVNGDGVITDADRRFSGSALPKFNVGLTTTVRYKAWDLVASGYGAYGQKIYDNTENALFFQSALTNGNNVPNFVLNNGEAATGNGNAPSTRFLHSGDFFRLSNLSLGYSIKGTESFVPWVKSMRIYVTGSNIFVITPYKGFDPEVNSNKQVNGIPSAGIDYVAYPKSRSFSFGLNINL